jgi:hypothetical protein
MFVRRSRAPIRIDAAYFHAKTLKKRPNFAGFSGAAGVD